MSPALATERRPSLLLADDHPTMLSTVSAMLAPHFDVLAAVNDGKAALDAALCEAPDLAVLDIRMPGLDGILTARELKQRHPDVKIAFLTGQEDDDYVSEALAAGATGYIVKRRMQSDLLFGLNAVCAGRFFISPHAFMGHSDEVKAEPKGISSAKSNHVPNQRGITHLMEFYPDENFFITRMGQMACESLATDKLVIVFLKRKQLSYISQQLRASGIEVARAIEWGDYRPFSVESVPSVLMINGRLDSSSFRAFFEPVFEQAARRARKKWSEVVVLGNLSTTLLDLGYDHENAFRIEELWNQFAQNHSCTIHCGGAIAGLTNKKSREALARICGEHCNVIPIDRYLVSQTASELLIGAGTK